MDRNAQPVTVGVGEVALRMSSPVLVGRDRELDALLAIAAHPPGVAIIEGEAGAGKSRLVHEALAHPGRVPRRVLTGRCLPFQEGLPLGPVTDALRGVDELPARRRLSPLTGLLRPLLPELARSLPPAPQPASGHEADRHLLFRAVLHLLEHLGPTILFLDDLHWADQTTAEFLRFLVGRLPRDLTVVLTYRREEVPERSPLVGLAARLPLGVASVRVRLEPLDGEEVRRLVAAMLDLEAEEVSVEFSTYLRERTAGIPFAVEEVLRLIEDRRTLVRSQGRWIRARLEDLAVPAGIRDLVLERLTNLGPDARTIARAAAVLGVPAGEPLLTEVAGLSGARAGTALSEALERAVLVELGDAQYGFRHCLASQSVYEAIPRPDRRRLHLRAAQALERGGAGSAEGLARHYREAGEQGAWLRCAEEAAEAALSVRDHHAAASVLTDVLRTPGLDSDMRARLVPKLAAAVYAGQVQSSGPAAILAEAARDGTLPPAARGEARHAVGHLRHMAGDLGGAREEWTAALDDLSGNPTAQARLMGDLSWLALMRGEFDDQLRWLRLAAETADRHGEPAVRLSVLLWQAAALTSLGDRRAADLVRQIDWRAASRDERVELAWGALGLASAGAQVGHYRRAWEYVEEAVRCSREVHEEATIQRLRTTVLLLRWLTADWSGLGSAARALADDEGTSSGGATAGRLVAARIAIAKGRLDDAEQALAPLAVERLILPARVSAAAARGRIALARGGFVEAWRLVAAEVDEVRRTGAWVWGGDVVRVAVEASLGCGDRGRAGELVSALAAGLRGRNAPEASAALCVCRGMLARAMRREARAVALFRSARRRWEALPNPYEAALAAEHEALTRFSADRDDALSLLRDVESRFSEIGAGGDAERVRTELRDRAAVEPEGRRRRGRRGYGMRLSPRERQVVTLAVRGLTNREIAEMIFTSRRTVGHQIEAAMHKLGVQSRRELSAELIEAEAARGD